MICAEFMHNISGSGDLLTAPAVNDLLFCSRGRSGQGPPPCSTSERTHVVATSFTITTCRLVRFWQDVPEVGERGAPP